MNNLQESLCRAIDIITENKINQIGYDKTIECLVTSAARADIGEYSVRYQDVILKVYSNNNTVKYRENTNVYVLVPQGDFSNKKTIIGAKETKGEEFIDLGSMLDKIEVLEGNYVDEIPDEHFTIRPTEERIPLKFKNEKFITDYKGKMHLLIGANIISNLINDVGNFGMVLEVTYQGENEDDEIEHEYKVGITDMTGNPYQLENNYQYNVFSLPLDNIKAVRGMYLYIEGFTEKNTSVNYVTFRNVEVAFTKPRETDGLDVFTGELIADKGTVFKNGVVNSESTLTLQMELKKVGRKFSPNAVYKWFFSDSTVEEGKPNTGWDQDGGAGWYYINRPTRVQQIDGMSVSGDGKTLTVTPDAVPNLETFKCVAIFGGEKVQSGDETKVYGVTKVEAYETIVDQTDALNIVINSSKGDLFKGGDGVEETTLTCEVYFGATLCDKDKFYYSWGKTNSKGGVDFFAKLRESNEYVVKDIASMTGSVNYVCEVVLRK